ncbi:hypothetical protein [Hoeflea sp.]|uniref:hypothetical protein n=1 Tax=Hoeflea sp. TaxID=1940281 RepID=UPI003B527B55
MPPFVRTVRKLVLALPVTVAIGATALAPLPAVANPTPDRNDDRGGSQGGGSRGERPEKRILTMDTLLRMSSAGIRSISRDSHRNQFRGPVGSHHTAAVLRALADAPDQSRRFLQRLERTKSPRSRKLFVLRTLELNNRKLTRLYRQIIDKGDNLRSEGYLVNYRMHRVFGQKSSDPEVQALYRLHDQASALESYKKLLDAVSADYDPLPLTLR